MQGKNLDRNDIGIFYRECYLLGSQRGDSDGIEFNALRLQTYMRAAHVFACSRRHRNVLGDRGCTVAVFKRRAYAGKLLSAAVTDHSGAIYRLRSICVIGIAPGFVRGAFRIHVLENCKGETLSSAKPRFKLEDYSLRILHAALKSMARSGAFVT